MREIKYFPFVEEKEINKQCYATAAIRLASLQSVRLRSRDLSSEDDSKRNKNPFLIHRPILDAMANLSEDISFALNIVSSPLPSYPLNGKINLTITITAVSETRQDAVSLLLSRYASFLALLSTFLPHAEFEVVKKEKALEEAMHPLQPFYSYSIDRFQDVFSLTVSPDSTQENSVGFLRSEKNAGNTEAQKIKYLFPWWQEGHNDLANVLEAMLLCPSPLWFQVRLRPLKVVTPDVVVDLQNDLKKCEELLSGMASEQSVLSLQTRELRKAISERLWQLNGSVFQGGCFLCSDSELDEALLAAVAGQISPSLLIKEEHRLQLKGKNSFSKISSDDFLDQDHFSSNGVFTIDEATCAFRVPFSSDQDPSGLPVKSYRTCMASADMFTAQSAGMLFLGNNRHRGFLSPIYVSDEDRMRHTCIMGQTGTGKSVFLESLILQDIYQGKGCCFIDPHGDSINTILQYYPKEREKDLVLIDFLDRDRVVPFNLLHSKDEEERDHIIDDLYSWLDATYDMKVTGGPIFESYFRGFLRLLMDDKKQMTFQPTMADFLRVFNDRDLRVHCLDQCSDQNVMRIITQANKAGGEAALSNIAPYITSKLNRFDLDKNLQLMTGQEHMAIDFDEIMNEEKVLLVNIGRGRFGENICGLLASQIVSRFQWAAMKRVDMKADKRKDFFLYIDEFQNIASESFISMLAEARKFRLGLVLANQYADQLERKKTGSGDSVLKAILGNVGNITCFRLGVNDAETMKGVFYPEFAKDDMVNLPIGNCYVNLKSGKVNPAIFSMETRLLDTLQKSEYVQKMEKASKAKYSIPRKQAIQNLENHNKKIDDLLG